MAIPLLAMALGGSVLGALANPEDRKKGALMGLGAGLLGPALLGGGAAAGAGTAAAGAAGGAGAAGAGAAGALGATGAATGAGAAGAATGAAGAAGGAAGAAGGAGAGSVASGTVAKKSLGQMAGGFLKENAGSLAGQGLMMAMQPKPGPQANPTDVTSGPVTAGQQASPYERAMVNMQAKRKQQKGPRRYI